MENSDLAGNQIGEGGFGYVVDVAEEDIPPYIQITGVPANFTDDEISPCANDAIDVPQDGCDSARTEGKKSVADDRRRHCW